MTTKVQHLCETPFIFITPMQLHDSNRGKRVKLTFLTEDKPFFLSFSNTNMSCFLTKILHLNVKIIIRHVGAFSTNTGWSVHILLLRIFCIVCILTESYPRGKKQNVK